MKTRAPQKMPKRARATIALPFASPAYSEVARRSVKETYGLTINAVGTRDLERYYELLRHGRQQARQLFTEAALDTIADVLRMGSWNLKSLLGLSYEVETAGSKRVANTLRECPPSVLLAVADAAEQYWRDPTSYGSMLACMNQLDAPEKG